MERAITGDEVRTYANALVLQFVKTRGIADLSQLRQPVELPPTTTGRRSGRPTSFSGDQGQSPLGPVTESSGEEKFDSVLESIIYKHLCRESNHDGLLSSTLSPERITIQEGVSIPGASPTRGQTVSLPEMVKLTSRLKTASSFTGNPQPRTPTKSVRKRQTMTSPSSYQTPKKNASVSDENSCLTVSPYHRRRKGHCGRGDDRPQTAPSFKPLPLRCLGGNRSTTRSVCNWIPDNLREKMVQRDLSVATQNLEFSELYRSSSMSGKHVGSSFEKSLSKEKFGIELRKPCGLCCMPFLPVNLVMAVPLKAVFDMRDSWGTKYDPDGLARVRVNPNLRRAPACYNKTRACSFCAQLFDQQQETYRPSWEAREAEKQRVQIEEEEARRKVRSDPLKQMEEEARRKVLSESKNTLR